MALTAFTLRRYGADAPFGLVLEPTSLLLRVKRGVPGTPAAAAPLGQYLLAVDSELLPLRATVADVQRAALGKSTATFLFWSP